MSYPFSLVLHTHLPMVVNHGRWPHGSDWLNEATFECYLPLLEIAHRLVAEGLSPKWTINISPVLTEQLASPEFQKELSFYYENVRRACVESRAHFTRKGSEQIVGLTYFWEEFYERMWELHRRIGGDIPGTFAELQRGGHLEIITCAATHGYLPLLSRDESIHLQLRAAVETHTRHFGQAPRGIWLPECAYRPRYEWTAPTGPERGRERRMRPGIEELLAEHGLEYFVADSHLVAAGEPVFLYRDFIGLRGDVGDGTSPTPVGERRSPYAPYRVASRGGTGSGDRLHPRSAHHAAGVEPRARLPGRVHLSWSSTRSTSRAGCASGRSPTARATSAPSRSTTPSWPPRRSGCRPATSSASCGRRSSRRATAGPRSCARPTTPSCSATGGSRDRSGSSRWSARWRATACSR